MLHGTLPIQDFAWSPVEFSGDHGEVFWAVGAQVREVAGGYRGQGYGSRAMELMQRHLPGRTIVALPGGDEGFWTSLGWQRYENSQGGDHPPLFVSPRVTAVGSVTGRILPL